MTIRAYFIPLIISTALLAQKPVAGIGGGGAGGAVAGAVTTGVTLASDAPVLGNGSATVKVGTKTGNTNNFATSTGTLTPGNCTETDANGNFVDAGAPCGTGGGGSTASPANYSQAFTAQTSVSLTHSLGTSNVLVKCYDGSDVEVQPDTVTIGGSAPYNVAVTFLSSQTGRCTVSGGSGVNGPLYCADAGANDTYACTLPVCPTAYAAGQNFLFKANTANTGTATANFCALGAKTIYKLSSGVTTTLADNDIRAGQIVLVAYDGTNLLMLSALGNAASGGSSITYGTYSALPGSCTDGYLYRTSDSIYEFQCASSAWVAFYRGRKVTIPPTSGWSWSNQGTSTVDTSKGFITLIGQATGAENLRQYVRTLPAHPYTITLCVQTLAMTNHVGLGWKDSSGGGLAVVSLNKGGNVGVNYYNSATSYSSTAVDHAMSDRPTDCTWVKLQDNSTNRYAFISTDNGINWKEIYSATRTTHITPDQFVIYTNSNSGTYQSAITLISYE